MESNQEQEKKQNKEEEIETITIGAPTTEVEHPKIEDLVKNVRKTFNSRVTYPKEWRLTQLDGLSNMIQKEEKRILEALHKDLRKPEYEAISGELSGLNAEIKEAKSNLSSWMSPKKVSTPMFNVPVLSSSYLAYQPVGVVLIIAPWNYPVNLLLAPLIGAISAGCCSILKPSEVAPATSSLLTEIIPKYLDSNCIKIVEGGIQETTDLLKQKFDHIFYTGNTTVGRVVMRAASEHLCPVTLELGGKNPCFVDNDVDLEVAARRIAWAKGFNLGQSCLSIDYVIVKKDFQDKFISALIQSFKKFYGEDPKKSPDLARIINKRHTKRIAALLSDIDPANIVYGGQVDEDELYIAPTIIKNVPLSNDLKIMQEEIFGPILPIIAVDDLDTAIEFVNSNARPLSIYVFSKDSKYKEKILYRTHSGGALCNDALVHFVQGNLPFGGIGESGMGSYHGKRSFLTFSHERSVLDKTTMFDLDVRYPPFSEAKLNKMKSLM